MWFTVLRCLLIFSILHLHAPACLLQACCQPVVKMQTKAQPACPCCHHEETEQEESAPDCPKSGSPCKCPCAILASGFLPVVSTTHMGQVQVEKPSYSEGDVAKTEAGFKLGIQRPPRS